MCHPINPSCGLYFVYDTNQLFIIECVGGDSLISDGPLLDSLIASDSIPSNNVQRLVDN